MAVTLRGTRAEALLAKLESGDAQQVMVPVTGNYKRGNGRRPQYQRIETRVKIQKTRRIRA
ncbi:MAG: hypothetical protein GY722_23150 [bacterium]|nr:hypothetical protein [bacterium]